MNKVRKEKEREEYLELLASYGMTEEEDEAMTDIMHDIDFES